jgi:hypothetical protein
LEPVEVTLVAVEDLLPAALVEVADLLPLAEELEVPALESMYISNRFPAPQYS